jgi:hypothetical protein
MMIAFLKQWRRHMPMSRWECPDGMANVLIMRGLAEEVRAAHAGQIAEVTTTEVRPSKPRKYQQKGIATQ